MDSIADALIRIKNAYSVGKIETVVRYSKLILEVCRVLKEEGYIKDYKHEANGIMISLKYSNRVAALTDVKRVSRPSLRIYKGAKFLPIVLNGLGIAIVSTPKGVMTGKTAKGQNLGGEVLALVW